MNIESLHASARSVATIIPADALSKGSYCIGNQPHTHDLGEVNQLFGMKVSAMDTDVVLDLQAGDAGSAGTALIAGAAGLDADGQEIALDEVHVFHVRNTGQTVITAVMDSWTGGEPPFSAISLPVGGEAMFILPAGEPLTAAQVTFATDAVGGAFELVAMGKN